MSQVLEKPVVVDDTAASSIQPGSVTAPNNWQDVLEAEKKADYFQNCLQYVRTRREQGAKIYPPAPYVFNAFKLTPFESVKVVILGQDPYHGPGQAHGLSFSVPEGVRPPPSLQNMFKEIHRDLGIAPPNHGCLESWAKQGVLLLNTVLTVEESTPGSHYQIGWEKFTSRVFQAINQHKSHVVFMLWGSKAQQKKAAIDARHTVLTTTHPSPLSAHRGFLGSGHFSKANQALVERGEQAIDWSL